MSDTERKPGPLEGQVVERRDEPESGSHRDLEVRIASELLERARAEGVSLVGQGRCCPGSRGRCCRPRWRPLRFGRIF